MGASVTNRNQGVDLARGLVILYVVVVVHGAYWLAPGKGELKALLLFEMPAIFLISGHAWSLAERAGQHVSSQADYLRHAAARLTRILVPYLFYCLCCALLVYLHAEALAPGRLDLLRVMGDWTLTISVAPEHQLGRLDQHLWFVPPFLAVTLALPLVTAIRLPAALRRLPVWAWLLALGAVLAALEASALHGRGNAAKVVFYLSWAVLGYLLDGRLAIPRRDDLLTLLIAALVLAASARWAPQRLNMQAQKFPPTWTFLAFSAIWITALRLLARQAGRAVVERLHANPWVQPFIRYSYSIYLWQGVGYTVVVLLFPALLSRGGLWWLAMLPPAVALSVALGTLASPLERMRIVGRPPATGLSRASAAARRARPAPAPDS
ncbi:MAG: acyltransferase [Aquabacterium sp.]|nr:MAG: acyltransferase [Aquabacterium sp.]